MMLLTGIVIGAFVASGIWVIYLFKQQRNPERQPNEIRTTVERIVYKDPPPLSISEAERAKKENLDELDNKANEIYREIESFEAQRKTLKEEIESIKACLEIVKSDSCKFRDNLRETNSEMIDTLKCQVQEIQDSMNAQMKEAMDSLVYSVDDFKGLVVDIDETAEDLLS